MNVHIGKANTILLQGSILIIRMPSVAYVQQTPFCCQSDSYNSKTSNTLSQQTHSSSPLSNHPSFTPLLSFLHCTWNDVHPPFHLQFFIPLKNSSFYPGNRQTMLPLFTSNRYRYKKWNAAVNRSQSLKERVAHHSLKQEQEISTKGTTPGFGISNPSDSLFGHAANPPIEENSTIHNIEYSIEEENHRVTKIDSNSPSPLSLFFPQLLDSFPIK